MNNDMTAQSVYVFPVSFAQERLWILDQMQPGNPAYIIPAAVRLKGSLSADTLERTLKEIIRRHEALRTTFDYVEGRPVQVVKPTMALSLPLIDLSDTDSRLREAKALSVAAQHSERAFDLKSGPLLRAELIRLDEQDHLLLLARHHIISDGWSSGVLIEEIVKIYEAFLQHKPSPLTELSIQYPDYANWQRQWMQGEALDERLAYWKRQLGGSLPVLQLPTDWPRPAAQSFRGANEPLVLSNPLTDSLKAMSYKEGVTLFMTLLAAFDVLFFKYTNQEDILVGVPMANRNDEEVESLIGCFINPVVARTDLSGDPTFRELLERVRQVVLEADSHQDAPFVKLIEELQPGRDLSRSPLFQVMLAPQSASVQNWTLPGLDFTSFEIDIGASELDLLLVVNDTAQGLSGYMQYDTDLFEADTIRRMLDQFTVLLEAVAANPGQRISRLSLLTEDEKRLMLAEWNDTNGDYSESACIHHLFETQAERTPHATAVVCEGKHLTYGQLNRRANQLAHRLQRLGVGPDMVVGLCMERSLEMVVGLLGVLKAGAAYLPLDPQYPKERLAFMIKDVRAQVLLTQQRLADLLPWQRENLINLDTEWEAICNESDENPTSPVRPENLAYVIYTSGSTGRPKGTMIQHGSLVSYTETAAAGYGIARTDRVLQFCSISFDISAEEIYPCLTQGATLVLRTDWMLDSVATFLNMVAGWGVSVLSLPTAYWHEITGSLGTEVAEFPGSLRLIIIAGERALPQRLAGWHKHVGRRTRLINTYGLTESTIISTLGELTEAGQTADQLREVPVGRPIRNTQVYILDSNLQPVPVGMPGEIHIGGLLLARGYFDRPDATAVRFIPNPFGAQPGARVYKTGDLARYLPDKNIEFLGRNDNQVKVRGFRIELREIELVLGRHPSLRDVVVLARQDSHGEKRVLAYVVAKPDQIVTTGELRSFLKRELPEYMVPSAFILMDALPLTPNGKLDRAALPAPNGVRPTLAVDYVPPRTKLEQDIIRAWQEVLKVEAVGIHDNFFDLGGHSLSIIQLRHKLQGVISKDIAMVELFSHPTVNSFAEHISSEGQPLPAQSSGDDLGARREARKHRRELRRQAQAKIGG